MRDNKHVIISSVIGDPRPISTWKQLPNCDLVLLIGRKRVESSFYREVVKAEGQLTWLTSEHCSEITVNSNEFTELALLSFLS